MAVLKNQQADSRWWYQLRKGSHGTADGNCKRMVAPKEIEWLPWVLRESKCAFLSCRVANERPAALELGCTNELLLPCVTWRRTSLSTLVRLALESGEPICWCDCADQRRRGSTSPSKRFKLLQRAPLWSEPLRVIVGRTEIDSTRTSQFRFHPIPAISPTATAQASLLARR